MAQNGSVTACDFGRTVKTNQTQLLTLTKEQEPGTTDRKQKAK